ncbi:MAG: hypothetical protein RMJ54_16580 [Roseiflexaceae bacterium]|nr:hypothetical protein [Roseiflexaceae bacterium]
MSITESSQPDQILNAAITAIRAGETERGRALLAQVLRANPSCESAWLWMATIAETPHQKRECLERALAINPQNSITRRRLQSLGITALPVAPVRTQRAVDPAVDASSAPVDVARCPNCGAAIDTTDRRCDFCGSLLHPLPQNPDSILSSDQSREQLSWEERRNLIESRYSLSVVRSYGFLILSLMLSLEFIFLYYSFHFLSGLFLLIFLIPGLFLFFAPSIILHRGSRAEARIIDMWVEEDEGKYWNYVAWELSVPDQRGGVVRFRNAQGISSDVYSALKARDTVFVRFFPQKPQYSGLDKQWLSEIKKR